MNLLRELFLTQPLESHCAPAAGNYQVKSARPWIIQCGCCTIKSGRNHSMLPNNYVSIHTWISAMNNKHNNHVTPTPYPHPKFKYATLKCCNDKNIAERMVSCCWDVNLNFTVYSLSCFVLWKFNLFWHIKRRFQLLQLPENHKV